MTRRCLTSPTSAARAATDMVPAALSARDDGLAFLGDGRAVSYVAADNGPSNRLAERRDHRAEASLGDGQTHVWRHGDTA